MFSRILIKLIDKAILPAILLLTARVVSLVALSHYFSINYKITTSGIEFMSLADYTQINSYSLLTMVIAIMLGISWILIKSFVFHESHIHPKTTAKLFTLQVPSFIQSSFDLYSQASVWLSYSYLLLIISAVMTFYGIVYSWVLSVSLILTLISTVLFVIDIENEMKLGAKNDK